MLISTAIHFKDFHLRPGEICLYSQGLGRSPRKFHVCSEYFVSKLVAANSTVICYLLIHPLVTYMWKASDLDSSFVQILR